jgi:hypothetical protein
MISFASIVRSGFVVAPVLLDRRVQALAAALVLALVSFVAGGDPAAAGWSTGGNGGSGGGR